MTDEFDIAWIVISSKSCHGEVTKIPGQDRMMIGQTQHKALLLRYAIFISFVQLLCQTEQYDRPLT